MNESLKTKFGGAAKIWARLCLAMLWCAVAVGSAQAQVYIQGRVLGGGDAGVSGIVVYARIDWDHAFPYGGGGFTEQQIATTGANGDYAASVFLYGLPVDDFRIEITARLADNGALASETPYYFYSSGNDVITGADVRVVQKTSVSAPSVGTASISSITTAGANISSTISHNAANQPRYSAVYANNSGFSSSTETPNPALVYARAADFNGSGDHARAASATYFNGGDFTIEGWVYVRSHNNWARMVDFGNGAANNNVLIALSQGTGGYPGFFAHNVGTEILQVRSGWQLPLHQWVHLAAVYTSANRLGILYMNGTEVGRATASVAIPNVTRNNNYIGRSNWGGDGYANALMDEVRIWSSARTLAQVSAGRTQALGSSAVAAWNFDYAGSSEPNLGTGGAGLTASLYNFDTVDSNGKTDDSLNAPGLPPVPTTFNAGITGLSADKKYYGKVKATSAAGNTESAAVNFTTAVATPTATVSNFSVNEDAGSFTIPITGLSDGDANREVNLKLEVFVTDPSKFQLTAPSTGTRSKYQRIAGDFTWEEAQRDAVRRGGYLAIITSAEENELVRVAFSNQQGWIGLSDTAVEGTYRWVDNTVLGTYRNWATGEPNDYGGNEDCIAMYVGGTWNDWPSTQRLSYYVLEYDDLATGTSYATATLTAGTTSYNLTGNTYFNVNGSTAVRVRVTAEYGDGRANRVDKDITVTVNAINDPPTVGMGTAIDLTSGNAHVQLPSGNYFTGGAFTVESWVYLESVKNWSRLFDFGNGSSANNVIGGLSSGTTGRPFLTIYNGASGNTSTQITATESIPLNTWTHLAFVFDGTTGYVYMNGEEKARGTMTAPNNVSRANNYIGRSNWASDSYADARLSEFRLWNTARSQTDLKLYSKFPLRSDETNLQVYYRLLEGAGTTVYDFATDAVNQGGTQNGTFSGTLTWIPATSASALPMGTESVRIPVAEDEARVIYLPGFDFETSWASLTWSIVTSPTNGTMTAVAGLRGGYTYTPNTDVNGYDRFTYRVSDGSASADHTVYINISPDNDAPVISTIANQNYLEGTVNTVQFTASDNETASGDLVFGLSSSDPGVVLNTGLTITSSGVNRVLTITPNAGESGTTTITITVTDTGAGDFPAKTVTTSFEVSFEPLPAYAILDLGVPSGYSISEGAALNDKWEVVGNATAGNNRVAFFYPGPASTAGLTKFTPESDHLYTKAASINNSTVTFLASDPASGVGRLALDTGAARTLITAPTGASSVLAAGLTDDLTIVGSAQVSSVWQAIRGLSGASAAVVPFPSGFTASYGYGVNWSNHIVGVATTATAERGFIYNGTTSTTLPLLTGGAKNAAYGINNQGQIVGTSETTLADGTVIDLAAGRYATAPAEAWFTGTGLTVEAWVYVRAHNHFHRLIDFANGSSSDNVLLALSSGTTGRPYFAILRAGTSQSITAPSALSLNTWTHVAATWTPTGNDTGTAKLYVNGTMVQSGTIGAPRNVTRLLNYIGKSHWATDGQTDALIENLRVWSTDRTAAQIVASKDSFDLAGTANLMAEYRFDEGSGTTALDTSGNARNATLVGGSVYSLPGTLAYGSVITRAALYTGSAVANLGGLAAGANSYAYAVNEFGKVAGKAVAQNAVHATLFAAGTLHNLNSLVSEEDDNAWHLTEARGINRQGALVGTGIKGGSQRGFLALPATIVGRKVVRPQGAVTNFMPDIEIIDDKGNGTQPGQFFYWSPSESKLFATRPCVAKLKWHISSVLSTNIERIEVITANIWPKNPTLHVVGAPVVLEPKPENGVFGYGFQQIHYPDEQTMRVTVDSSTKIFGSKDSGYSVIRYLRHNGEIGDPTRHPAYFEVVRSYNYTDPVVFKDNVAWSVGDTIVNANHYDYGRNGWVFFEKSFYDGYGPDRAYDRPTRIGPIIPVNTDTSFSEDLVIGWYQLNGIGVAWPGQSWRYSLSWPSETQNKIILASQLGSGTLDPLIYKQPRVYLQPDEDEAGFNPNEEHALMAPADTGVGIFALRKDLNTLNNYSEPYALLKYKNSSDEWAIKVYKVISEEAPYFFRYSGEAGKEIQAPYPLRILPLCDESEGVSGPHWEDFKGKIYARAAGQYGDNAEIVIQYFYPLQPDFWAPPIHNSTGNYAVGACIPWLDRLTPTSVAGTPHNIVFDIKWPDNAPILNIGQTAAGPGGGLPDFLHMADARIIYDDHAVNSDNVIQNLARLYDPISDRVYSFSASEKIPDGVQMQNINGKEYFKDLPWAIQTRLTYDPINKTLTFKGHYDPDFDVGDPLLLPNVLTTAERERIKKLKQGDTSWASIINQLYDLTRNPNQLDSDWNGTPEPALMIGLAYTTNTVEVSDSRFNQIADGDDGEINPRQLVSFRDSTSGMTIEYRVIQPEQFGDIPKALTAGLHTGSAQTRPGQLLQMTAAGDEVNVPSGVDLSGKSFTIEFWAKRLSATGADFILSQGTGAANSGLHIGFRETGQFAFAFYDNDLQSTESLTTTDWNHYACVYDADTNTRTVYRNGRVLVSDTAAADYIGSGDITIGSFFGDSPFHGQLDELRIWTRVRNSYEVRRDMRKAMVGTEQNLALYLKFDNSLENLAAQNAAGLPTVGSLSGAAAMPLSDAPAGIPPRFVTVAENDNEALGSPTISLHVVRVDDGPYAGDLKVLLPSNIFDERLTLRQSPDFGGDPNPLDFEWWYYPSTSGQPPELPDLDLDGNVSNSRAWIRFNTDPADGAGINQITIGEGGESSIITLSDNWFISRYKGYEINGVQDWSDWIGDPASRAPRRPVLAEGWIKRVIRGLNPFDQRVSNFRETDVNTLISMLSQAGGRYEGDIAFNPGADAINGVGLIEAYETVLRRGRNLSMDGVPALNYAPANNAILLAATRIADLYTLLGNEAYSDAQDPTIGFGTVGTVGNAATYGSLASSIFAFQNQLDSLLEEELVLLRGRDDRAAGTQGTPIYNRLFWNFTLGEGEVAYQQNYNVTDQNFDGFIDDRDARKMYPQGHGDAWGHYLKALKTHYDLLRHPYFTWIPTTEAVVVAGAAIEVDFQDERKFARTAALKAKAGAEIVDLTYRNSYVEDPDGQWQGYQDTDTDRAWGVTEWSRRGGHGAYFDWLTANTVLPAVDTNPNHEGIQKVDRTTVFELKEIAAAHEEIQRQLDASDEGLNPLGLVRGAVPFDIDPAQVSSGKTHFEQVLERAHKGMNNAIATWNEANKANELLRRNQDTLEQFRANVIDQERDYKNRLIEIYGYPYAGQIGAGKIYPSGYDGPDIYHYMYVNTVELNNDTAPPSASFTAYFSKMNYGIDNVGNTQSGAFGSANQSFYFPEDVQGDISDRLEEDVLVVPMPSTTADWGFKAPAEWGQRRAPGKLQEALGEMIQHQAAVKYAALRNDNLLADIDSKINVMEARYDLRADTIRLNYDLANVKASMSAVMIASAATSKLLWGRVNDIRTANEIMIEAMPKVIGLAMDPSSGTRAFIKAALAVGTTGLTVGAAIADGVWTAAQQSIYVAEGLTQAKLANENFNYEVTQHAAEIEALMRQEAVLRVEAFRAVEAYGQAVGRFKKTLAEGNRLIEERVAYRQRTAGSISNRRYQDMTFRIFRNDALQKYRAQFDLAQRYVYLAASAYDYEVNLLGTDSRAGQAFLTDIIRQRALGQVRDGIPIAGAAGLADPLARLEENFGVLKTQLGFNNPQTETGRFSLRNEFFRLRDSSDTTWRSELQKAKVDNLWTIPEFRRFCRPFAPENAGAQPGLVFRFPTAIRFGENFFGWPLAGGDSAYDPSRFATKVRSVGVWFSDYNGNGMSVTPRVYLVPAGVDILRSPTGNDLSTRQWRVMDQALPVPFTIGSSQLNSPTYIPSINSLGGSFTEIRRFASFRAYHDSGYFTEAEAISDSRLIGRSVWNTEWMLIIPGGTLLANPNTGIQEFIDSVSDIKLFFQTYSYAGN